MKQNRLRFLFSSPLPPVPWEEGERERVLFVNQEDKKLFSEGKGESSLPYTLHPNADTEQGFTKAQSMVTQMNYSYIKSPNVILTETPSTQIPLSL